MLKSLTIAQLLITCTSQVIRLKTNRRVVDDGVLDYYHHLNSITTIDSLIKSTRIYRAWWWLHDQTLKGSRTPLL
jgi:hypothetical protein